MRLRVLLSIVCAFLAAITADGALSPLSAETVAKQLFGKKSKAADLKPQAIGSYAKGCLAGGAMLPVTGPAWQAMRLSRNRNWGHPVLVDYVQGLATDSQQKDGWPGLLVGDLAQPRGGPMLTGHRSHQIGLDADIWLMPMPKRTLSRSQREKISAISMIKSPFSINEKHWKPGHPKLLRRAASDRRVARIFVHPAIKKALCESPEAGSWLNKVRPWWGHHYHFHVRLRCPRGSEGCVDQKPPPAGRGCGDELESWFKRFRKAPPKKPKKTVKKPKRRELRMADLPAACRTVLKADDKLASASPARRATPASATAPVRKPATKKRVTAPLPDPKPQAPTRVKDQARPTSPPTQAPPPVKAPAQATATAPMPSPKPKAKPRTAPAVAAKKKRSNTDPNLPWLRGITTPVAPLPDRRPGR